MIRRHNSQRTLDNLFLFGSLSCRPEELMDPVLRRIDQLLDEDDAVVDGVLETLRNRRPKSATRGRFGTPAETVLRMLVLKHLRNWTYDQLEWEVTGNIVYRRFCRIDGGKVPDAKTVIRLNKAIAGEDLRRLFEQVVELAVKKKPREAADSESTRL